MCCAGLRQGRGSLSLQVAFCSTGSASPPRQLAQEALKLATAAGADGTIDEELVRGLTFPRERSLEVVRDAVLSRDGASLFDLLAAAAGGSVLRGSRGERIDNDALPLILLGQVASLLAQLLYLRRVAVELGLAAELDPGRSSSRSWYSRTFKGRMGGELRRYLGDDPESPWSRAGRTPTEWTLGQLFAGAGRYRDDDLVGALADAGQVEAAVRGPTAMEAVAAWLSGVTGSTGGSGR